MHEAPQKAAVQTVSGSCCARSGLVRNTGVVQASSGLAGKAEKVDEAAPLQAAVQQGEQLLIGLARKFLRSGAAFLGAT